MSSYTLRKVRAGQVELAIKMPAGQDRLWQALTAEIDEWWPEDFYISPKPNRIELELQVGGRLYEEGGGRSLLWYTVTEITKPASMHFTGHIAPPWGGPATSLLHLKLTAESDTASTLTVFDALFGKIDEKMLTEIESGWRTIFEGGLEKYLKSS